jgi:hypothetical protein
LLFWASIVFACVCMPCLAVQQLAPQQQQQQQHWFTSPLLLPHCCQQEPAQTKPVCSCAKGDLCACSLPAGAARQQQRPLPPHPQGAHTHCQTQSRLLGGVYGHQLPKRHALRQLMTWDSVWRADGYLSVRACALGQVARGRGVVLVAAPPRQAWTLEGSVKQCVGRLW